MTRLQKVFFGLGVLLCAELVWWALWFAVIFLVETYRHQEAVIRWASRPPALAGIGGLVGAVVGLIAIGICATEP